LRAVLEQQLRSTREKEIAEGHIIPWLFHHANGRPIKSYRHAFQNACRSAGQAGKLVHDFRRTAVRNLGRARECRVHRP
jgi:integrase